MGGNPHRPGRGYPGMDTPRHGMGYPPEPEMGYPSTRQISIGSTCYTVGSMPLACMQEDFLVKIEYLFISIAGFFDWGSKLLDEIN